ncbi:CarD family transcriptional regulator, partial [Elioraea rosea]|uniref:CarD family transcriptional regulator n=1 Tax=Elioraea rosea TaxID=2492390 RepID=UPI001EF48B13
PQAQAPTAKPPAAKAPAAPSTPAPAAKPAVAQGPRPPAPGAPKPPATTGLVAAEPPQFTVGDHVVYPTHGVGRVTGVVNEEIAGHKLTLIVIEFEENRMVLRVPVAKARTAGLRKLSTRKAIDTALATLKGRARIKRTMWSRRAQEYEAKINSGDPVAIAEVVRDLHRNAGQPDQSFSERQIYEQAMDRLAAELAAIDGIDKPAAQAKLATVLKAA